MAASDVGSTRGSIVPMRSPPPGRVYRALSPELRTNLDGGRMLSTAT